MRKTHFRRCGASGKSRGVFLSAAAILLAAVSIHATSCQQAETKNLTIWTYDSFVSEWGPGAGLAKLYEQKTGIKIDFVSKGDGGALLSAILAGGKNIDADLVIGLDNNLASQATASGLFSAAKLPNLGKIDSKLLIDNKNRLIPYDYGNFAFIWDCNRRSPSSEPRGPHNT